MLFFLTLQVVVAFGSGVCLLRRSKLLNQGRLSVTRSFGLSLSSQGRLQLWVDMFPKEHGDPGTPFNVEPRKPSQ